MPGQWAGSTRKARLPADWHARRAACYRDAGGRCQIITDGQRCTWTGPLNGTKDNPGGHADHINRELGEDGPRQWLCPPHHRAKTTLEGTAALPRERRPAPQHPGMV